MASALFPSTDEVVCLQTGLREKETATETMAEEVVTLTTKLEEQSNQASDAPAVKEKLDTLEKRYATLLELFDEREERVRELMTVVANVRVISKEQLNDLISSRSRLESERKVVDVWHGAVVLYQLLRRMLEIRWSVVNAKVRVLRC